jgi:hypothetical protein
MNGPDHYREAERLLDECCTDDGFFPAEDDADMDHHRNPLMAAQVHATLALAASNIEAATRRPSAAWTEVVA